jgi:hypothetical protein
MEIIFKKIKFIEDTGKVEIEGELVNSDCPIKKMLIKMSILQLAKVWSTDRERVSIADNDFGSAFLEDKCIETRKLVKKFPKVQLWDKEIDCGEVTSHPVNYKEYLSLFAEDLCGWNNEGIEIKMSKEFYEKEVKGKRFKLILTPFKIKLGVIK